MPEHYYEYIYDENTPKFAFFFNSKIKMNAQAYPEADRELLTGVADALDIVSVEGLWDSYGPSFMTNLVFRFNDRADVTLKVFGEDSHWTIKSNLFGEDMPLLIDYKGLVEFAIKTYSRLDLPLQYIALALPNDNLRQAVDWTRAAWYYVMERDKTTHVIPKWYLLDLAEFLSSIMWKRWAVKPALTSIS
ncbi:MAG: hypothetical protein Q4C54_02890 [Clostridia bacterium]|nr:hypothetical protein [Clostridia bacterium]